jgi:hypothetical protein
MSKQFKRDRRDDAPQYGDAMPPLRTVGDDHGAKSQNLRTLIARCLRAEPQLFVREMDGDSYSIMVRDREAIPRTHFLDEATFDECMEFLDTYT